MDWVGFFTDHNIEYVTRGPNTKKGNISIQCPYCGNDDPSQHMGVSLTQDKWGCWRSEEHSGRKAYSLIQAILGCSFAQARLIETQYSTPDPEDLEQALASLTGEKVPVLKPKDQLVLPDDFRGISRKSSGARFWDYLQRRGFDDVAGLADCYGLRCAVTGPWKDRVIFPLHQDKRLVGWTGRALQTPVNAPRYLTLSEEDGALVNVKNTVYLEDRLSEGGEVLLVSEGPFDAIKLDFYGYEYGASATCVYGTSMTVEQIAIIAGLTKKFDRTILLLDAAAVGATFSNMDWLEAYGVEYGSLPEHVKDPGAMSPAAIRAFVKGL